MPMRSMTRLIAEVDARLQLKRRLLAEAADPDDLASLYEDIDALLEERTRLTGGTHRA